MLRSVFTAAAAAPALAACDLLDSEPPPPPPPDQLTEFYGQTAALIQTYETAIAATPAAAILVTVRDAHKAHLAALAAIMKPAPSGSPVPASPSTPRGEVRQAEQQARLAAIEACMTAPPNRATLLGEIAAARACHLEVLP
ncbi:hypothetical protein Rhe02_40690 [Rhizocola hellebori]|uniref:Uncharacterized protein n=1 Tax=Rhizocola hellebori TaxID=1392758 RepID=A0A8J3Q9V0_9ACTN|nr:hypothetical protein Rhe02_40690 [Rhizocola hellebori]